MTGRYDYQELLEKALATKNQEDINALGEWFEQYGTSYWNGENYTVTDTLDLYPIYKQINEDDYAVIGYELR